MTDGYNMLLIGGIPTIVVNILLLMVNIWLIYWLIYDYFMVIIWLMMVLKNYNWLVVEPYPSEN